MHPMIPAKSGPTRHALWLPLLIGAAGCTTESPVSPGDAQLAKAAGGISVTAADPAWGKQGESGKQVVITGSGFAPGDQASWQRNGAADPRITVVATEFVSATQLRATINIAGDAELAFYDIAILRPGRKGGIGTELFEVTYGSPVPGASAAWTVNDNGRLVAVLTGGQMVTYDIATGTTQSLGYPGQPLAIDELGTTIAGIADNSAAIWTFAGSWSQTMLPRLEVPGGHARTIVSDLTGQAAIIGGFVHRPVQAGKKTGFIRHPAKWTRDGTGTWILTLLEQPVGRLGNEVHGIVNRINPSGLAAGFDGTGCCYALYWDAAGTVTVLPDLITGEASAAWSINDAGTMIVGTSAGLAVTWSRVSVTDPWSAPVPLETGPCTGVGRAINDAGIIVGGSCRGATAWRPTGTGYIPIALGTLGKPCNTTCHAKALSNGLFPIAVGVLGSNAPQSSAVGAYWTGF